MKPARTKGFTLIEAVVVLGIISLATISIPLLFQWLNRQGVRNAVEQLQADLQLSRVTAIRQGQPCVVRFNTPGLNQYVIEPLNRCGDLARYRGNVHFLKRGPDGKAMTDKVSFNCRGMSTTVVPAYIFIADSSGSAVYRLRIKLPGGISVHLWCGDHWR
jgi:prepilin-type N-terminal cleavage/methylation domain-containing protein